jgi:hypothetical protein
MDEKAVAVYETHPDLPTVEDTKDDAATKLFVADYLAFGKGLSNAVGQCVCHVATGPFHESLPASLFFDCGQHGPGGFLGASGALLFAAGDGLLDAGSAPIAFAVAGVALDPDWKVVHHGNDDVGQLQFAACAKVIYVFSCSNSCHGTL